MSALTNMYIVQSTDYDETENDCTEVRSRANKYWRNGNDSGLNELSGPPQSVFSNPTGINYFLILIIMSQ